MTPLGDAAVAARFLPGYPSRGTEPKTGGEDTLTHRVTLIPGDGIGPEVIDAARRAVEATGASIEWEAAEMGSSSAEPLPAETLDSIRRNGVALKGPVATPPESGLRSVNVALRQSLDLYAGIRPCRLLPGVPSPYEVVDFVVIRENTEDVYTGIEFEMGAVATKELIRFLEERTDVAIREDSGISIKTISIEASERIVRFAFDYAARNGRANVTASHKANIMKLTDGLFLATARRVAAEHPEIAFEERIIDALCMELVRAPERFDVLVMPNFYGDVVSDLGAGLIGGLGVAPGAHVGDDAAVFEATHGTAQKHAGKDRANPTAAMLSAALLLRHLGEDDAGDRLERAVGDTIAAGEVTADLAVPGGSPLGTRAFTEAVIGRL